MSAEITWEVMDDKSVLGYTYDGEEIVINALQDRAQCAKWNEPYREGRGWTVYNAASVAIASGRSKDLREAKKSATAALTQHLSAPQRLTDDEFQSLLDEYYTLECTIRDMNMSFHLGERRHRIIPSASQEALRERSARMDDLLAQEKALRDRLIQAAD